MWSSLEAFRKNVIGHKIVSVERTAHIEGEIVNAGRGMFDDDSHSGVADLVLTLDDGRKVGLVEHSECCAYSQVRKVIINLPTMDHVITNVTQQDGHMMWHIMAGMDDVLDVNLDWDEGSGYYTYGLRVVVQEAS